MSGLRIGPTLELPESAVTETFAILAKRGSGKTYTAKVMVEEMLAAGLPVAVVDPLGVWWGLRSSADGKSAGYPVVIFGGDHADVPIEQTAGALIADVIVDERIPAVLDLSGLSKSAQRRFMTDFAERLYLRNRNPLHLVIDEADAYAPQRTSADGARLLGAMEDLARRGRARGIGMTMITQRPAVLNKDLLTQAEVLIVLRMTGPRDVAAINEWVAIHAEEDEAKTVKASLPALPVGTAWVWSPGWLGALVKVAVRKATTFDSSATPKIGEVRVAPKRMADIDLTALGERITASVERAKADDPKALRARVADLEGQLAAVLAAKPEPVYERIEVPVLDVDLVARLEDALSPACSVLGEVQETLLQHRLSLGVLTDLMPKPAPHLSVVPAAGTNRPAQVPRKSPPAAGAGPGVELPKAQKLVLTALCQHGTRTPTQLALLTGYSHKGGGFRNTLGALRSAGWVEGRGDLSITEAGREALGDYEPLPTGRDLIDWWLPQLGGAEKKILLVLADAYPSAVAVPDIAAAAGYEASGGGFRNALGRLRSLELASGRGELVMADSLAGP